MKRVGYVLIAIGSGLGVWAITHVGDVSYTDLLIVIAFLASGAWLTSEEEDTK